jgi:hypothetical protein
VLELGVSLSEVLFQASNGHVHSWLLSSSALVICMQAPGLHRKTQNCLLVGLY